MLGWHAEGPFIQLAKRGAHAPQFLLPAEEGYKTIENVYGADNLVCHEDWLLNSPDADGVGVRIITAAPEIEGVRAGMEEVVKRGITFSIGHRYAYHSFSTLVSSRTHQIVHNSAAATDVATAAVMSGARLITHLFNAMPQLHHRDPSIIGLLGASPHLAATSTPTSPVSASGVFARATTSEALDELVTPPETPFFAPVDADLHLKKGFVTALPFERPYYELIVDGIHSHPNSVRVRVFGH